MVRRARDLERYRYIFALVGIGLLLMPLLPVVGQNINGARLWIRVGGVTFQPGEMAKIVLAIFFASYMVERSELLSQGTLQDRPLPGHRPQVHRPGAGGLGPVAGHLPVRERPG